MTKPSEPFYSRKTFFGARNGMLILLVVFFIVPFALRGARMAVQKTENNVKDWLPDSFRETEELAWFANKFVSEQFIVATWPGCHEDSDRFKMFVTKIRREAEESMRLGDEDNALAEARQFGADKGIFYAGDFHENWGGEDERWLTSENGRWYYIKPDGKVFRWEGRNNLVGFLGREFSKLIGSFKLDGTYIQKFEDPNSRPDDSNRFYTDPLLLSAPLFKKIETGPELVEQLASEGGPLYRSGQPEGARYDAIDRLTGTLFAPPVPAGFDWSVASMKDHLGAEFVATLPEGWDERLNMIVDQAVAENFKDRDALLAASPMQQSSLWYEFFEAITVTPPPRQTAVVITVTDIARENLKRVLGRGMLGTAPGRIIELADECGIVPPPTPTLAPPPFSWAVANAPIIEPSLRLGGPVVDNVAIDEEGTITLVRLIGYSVFLGLGLSYFCLRSTKLTMMVFFVGGTAAIASLSFVWWCNTTVDAVLLTMPSLVYVLGLSGAIHIINYYRDAVLEHGKRGAVEHAIKHAILPCSLAAVTTAIGLGSLGTSNILPIRKFGIFSALGVVATLSLLFLYLPSALTVFAPKTEPHPKNKPAPEPRLIDRVWSVIGDWVLRNQLVVNICCFFIVIAGAYGVTQIQTNVQLLKLFDSSSRIIKDYTWLEQNFGRLVPMELVVRFPETAQRIESTTTENGAKPVLTEEQIQQSRQQLSLLERLEAVSAIQDVVDREFGYEGRDIAGSCISAVTLLKDLPDPSRGFSPSRLAFDRLLNEGFDQLLETDYLQVEDGGAASGTELWRISLRLGALNDVDYGQFSSQMRLAVEPVVLAYRSRKEIVGHVLAQTSNDVNQSGGRVVVLGAAKPTENPSGKIARDAEVNCQAIYSDTLSAILANDPVKQALWHNPSSEDFVDSPQAREKFYEVVSKAHCLVVVADHNVYDFDAIRKINPRIVDVREELKSLRDVAFERRMATGKPVDESIDGQVLDVVYTGVVPVVYKAQRTLLESLFQSIGWAFVMIAGVMAILMTPHATVIPNLTVKNLSQALVAGFSSMAPNIFPVVVIFGAMGFMGIEVDIGSMMTASVAMGVAVDDTIHFLAWFRGGMREGMSRLRAVKYAFSRVAPAMTQTTLIGGLGLSVFALSTFTPTQRFGTLMLTLLAAALVGDLIFLPALLASPIGRFFEPADIKPKSDQNAMHGESSSLRIHSTDETGLAAEASTTAARSSHVPAPHLRYEKRRAKSENPLRDEA